MIEIGSGVNASVGSPASDVGQIARRGSYLSALDLFRGQNTATGLRNQAAGVLYSGSAAQEGADLSAFGTIAGGAGSLAQMFGRMNWGGGSGPSPSNPYGIRFG